MIAGTAGTEGSEADERGMKNWIHQRTDNETLAAIVACPDGGTGRRAGLKIRFSQESGSSTLPPGTMETELIMALPQNV
jgi:hypothetical protein